MLPWGPPEPTCILLLWVNRSPVSLSKRKKVARHLLTLMTRDVIHLTQIFMWISRRSQWSGGVNSQIQGSELLSHDRLCKQLVQDMEAFEADHLSMHPQQKCDQHPTWFCSLSSRNKAQEWKVWGFHCGSDGKESACKTGYPGLIPGWEDPLQKAMATHFHIFAWRIPWTKEPGGLQSIGPQRVSHTHTHTHAHTCTHTRRVYWLTHSGAGNFRTWGELGEWYVNHTCPASSWPALSSSHGFWVPKATRQDKPCGQALFKLLPLSYSTVTH